MAAVAASGSREALLEAVNNFKSTFRKKAKYEEYI